MDGPVPLDNRAMALAYLKAGWSIIPIRPTTKRPYIKWMKYQNNLPTEAEVATWWGDWPHAEIALVTGSLSGVVVVDCDSEDAAAAASEAGMVSPVTVETKRGRHHYFAHPRDDQRRGPRAGGNSRGVDWPKINGLDFRGDGSYAVLPPSRGYTWEREGIPALSELPVWQDWHPCMPSDEPAEFDFATLDLSGVTILHPDEWLSEWDRTASYTRENFGPGQRIPTGLGNARNERLMRFISECIRQRGEFGALLRTSGLAFMREFFVDALPPYEFEATVRSMEDAERRNYPERFDASGDYIPAHTKRAGGHGEGGGYPHSTEEGSASTAPSSASTTHPRLIRMADAEALAARARAKTYLIEPWLPPASIVQVHGYSGSGKSMFLQHMLAAMAAGKRSVGPFEVGHAGRVLYLDYEMSMGTIAQRLMDLRSAHGDTGDRFQIWTPFVHNKEMPLNAAHGLSDLQEWVKSVRPDIVVIDTARSAWPGLEENKSEAWAPINQLAVRLRNAGMSVILVHHSNKPGESGIQREAGSTNQLTVLETQIKVSQVYEDADTAKAKAGLWDGDYPNPVWPLLRGKAEAHGPDWRLFMVNEVAYGKVREWSDMHDQTQWVGYAAHDDTGEVMLVSSSSTKQKAKALALEGMDDIEIAGRLYRPTRIIREWLEADDPR